MLDFSQKVLNNLKDRDFWVNTEVLCSNSFQEYKDAILNDFDKLNMQHFLNCDYKELVNLLLENNRVFLFVGYKKFSLSSLILNINHVVYEIQLTIGERVLVYSSAEEVLCGLPLPNEEVIKIFPEFIYLPNFMGMQNEEFNKNIFI